MNLAGLLAISTLSLACITDPATAALESPSRSSAGPIVFIGAGSGASWFDAANWSTGRVPGPSDVVVIEDTASVVLDGDLAADKLVELRELHVREAAQLEVIHGAIVRTQLDTVDADAQVTFRASASVGDTSIVNDGLTLNPTPKSKRVVVLQSSVTVDLGLGGTTPASLAFDQTGAPRLAAGPGHYSTITADSVELAGNLGLSLYYGFQPTVGDVYQIMTVNGRRTGELANLPEGAVVACTDDLRCARISYRGGDGNDVTLTIEQHRTAPTTARMHAR